VWAVTGYGLLDSRTPPTINAEPVRKAERDPDLGRDQVVLKRILDEETNAEKQGEPADPRKELHPHEHLPVDARARRRRRRRRTSRDPGR
jgi:hypothetical protein